VFDSSVFRLQKFGEAGKSHRWHNQRAAIGYLLFGAFDDGVKARFRALPSQGRLVWCDTSNQVLNCHLSSLVLAPSTCSAISRAMLSIFRAFARVVSKPMLQVLAALS
jgi:hypothetical protein